MKKLWISIKRGLIREPKHRIAMGECVWLFQYMIDVADWDTGKIFGWKDEAAAEDMQMPIRTLREQRRKLESLDYIVCTQKQYDQEIAITNWTNPREYSGEVYNPKQGDSKAEPLESGQGYIQGYIQGDTQGSTQDVTPTFNPNNQIPNTTNGGKPPIDPSTLPIDWQMLGDKPVVLPDERLARQKDAAALVGMGMGVLAEPAAALVLAFQVERGVVFTESQIKGQRKAAKALIEQKITPALVTAAVKKLQSAGMTVTDLYSITKTAIDLANKNDAPKIGRTLPEIG